MRITVVTVVAAIALVLGVGACSQGTVLTRSQVLQAQGAALASGTVLCPPSNTPCGTYRIDGRPVVGSNIYDGAFTGQPTIHAAIGDTVNITFPNSGNTKFSAGGLWLTVGALDQGLAGKTITFTYQGSSVDAQGNVTYHYTGKP